MLTSIVKFSFICIILLPKLTIQTKTETQRKKTEKKEPNPAIEIVNLHVSENNFCIQGNNFEAVQKDTEASKLYVRRSCLLLKNPFFGQHVLEKYGQRTQRLGKGRTSNVYLYTKDINSPPTWAAKVPFKMTFEEFFQELNTSACIKRYESPQLIQHLGVIHECVWNNGGEILFFMKYYPKSLETFIHNALQTPFEQRTMQDRYNTLHLMKNIASLILNLHKQNLTHYDLKPSDIMLDDKLLPNLVDFGVIPNLPNSVNEHVSESLYTDYEVINDDPGAGYYVDVYSIGLIFYEMIAGSKARIDVVKLVTLAQFDYEDEEAETVFKPNFTVLKIPSEFSWLLNMLSPTHDTENTRWNLEQVRAMLAEMLARYREEITFQNNVDSNVNQNLDQAMENIADQSSVNITMENTKEQISNQSMEKPQSSAFNAMLGEFNKKSIFINGDAELSNPNYLEEKPMILHQPQKVKPIGELSNKEFREQVFDMFKVDRNQQKLEKKGILQDLQEYKSASKNLDLGMQMTSEQCDEQLQRKSGNVVKNRFRSTMNLNEFKMLI